MFGTNSDAVTVSVSDTECVVSTVSDSELVCQLGAVPAGEYEITVITQEHGKSKINYKVNYYFKTTNILHQVSGCYGLS